MSKEKSIEELTKEFLANGGKIEKCPKQLSPTEERRRKQLKKELGL